MIGLTLLNKELCSDQWHTIYQSLRGTIVNQTVVVVLMSFHSLSHCYLLFLASLLLSSIYLSFCSLCSSLPPPHFTELICIGMAFHFLAAVGLW